MTSIVIEDLTPAEKLELIDKLWDSLDAQDVPLTQAQLDELDRRLATADDDVARGKTWAALEESLSSRLK